MSLVLAQVRAGGVWGTGVFKISKKFCFQSWDALSLLPSAVPPPLPPPQRMVPAENVLPHLLSDAMVRG